MGWFLITILLPIIGPVAGYGFFKLLSISSAAAPVPNILTLFKDGQLGWAALGFLSSALYDIRTQNPPGILVSASASGLIEASLIFLIVMAVILAAGGAVFVVPTGVPAGARWYLHYKTMVSSFVVTTLAVLLYMVVHYSWLA